MACIFCDFISGRRRKHRNGLPFIPINKTKHTISFLSNKGPAHEDGHMLVIPKKHFQDLEDLPKTILHEIIEHVQKVSAVTIRRHQGCNVLLNNGKSAGQHVSHVHFHVIPRDPDDNINIARWKEKKMSVSQFKKLSFELQQEYSQ